MRIVMGHIKLGGDEGLPAVRVAPKAARGRAVPKPRPAVANALKSGPTNGRAKPAAHELDCLGGRDGEDGFTEF